ncbi:MAG TPA: FAD:protein FMN transferase, partial [Ilumatobacteraceae bacterium]
MSPLALARRSDASPPPPEHHFRAMGSDAHVIIVGGNESMLALAIDRIEELESRWSRFRPDSEVSVLNAHSGQPVPMSADTRLLVARAVEAWRLTGGSFDPTLLDDLQRAGYDRSFEQLSHGSGLRTSLARRRTASAAACTDIVVDDCSVTLPFGMSFDAGGIGKGLAADLVARGLIDRGARTVLVSLGGDLRARGEPPPDGAWDIPVEDPGDEDRVAFRYPLVAGALVTSTTAYRNWRRNGRRYHHIIDPATG